MPTIDATNMTQGYNYAVDGNADFSSHVSNSSTTYSWLTGNGHLITVEGTGITVDGSNSPTGGTITSVSIDILNNSPGTPDLVISDVSFDLAALFATSAPLFEDAFWRAVLQGPVAVLPGASDDLRIGGDFREVYSNEVLYGASDSMFGENIDGTYAYGEGVSVRNAALIAGNDSFSGSFDVVYGDIAVALGSARVVGGHDSIVFTLNWTGDSNYAIFGDASQVTDTATMFGGNDLIDASSVLAPTTGTIYGDVSSVLLTGLVVGGDDTIFGSAGMDVIYGDAKSVSGNGTVISGNDVIHGGGSNDEIHGDVTDVTGNASAQYGNDMLFGDAGKDTLFGNGGDDTLDGGNDNDKLYGEDGADDLNGGAGFDTLYGGADNDTLNGGNQADLLYGQDGDDHLFGANGADRLFGGQGKDTLDGDGGNDKLDGGSQNDVLNGLDGNDRLLGSSGSDTLTGGAGDDTLTGGFNADRFVFADGFGNDVITDFASGNDAEKIDLRAVSAIVDFADLTDAGNPHMTQVGADVVIDDFAGNTITVLGVNIGDMNAADFIF